MRTSYAETLSESEPAGFLTRSARWLNGPVRPHLGWIVFIACLVLVLMPANAMRANRWIRLDQTTNFLSQAAAYGVIATWWLMGWRRSAVVPRYRWLQRAALLVTLALVGLLVVSVLVVQWIPPLDAFVRAIRTGDVTPLLEAMYGALDRFNVRYSLWRMGTQAGVAAADEVVFAFFSGLLLWWLGVFTAWLCYRGKQPFITALPTLLVTGAIVFIGGGGPFYFIFAIALMLLLYLALDTHTIRAGWDARRLDYSRELLLERWATAAALIAVALVLAWFTPSISIQSIADAYANFMDPVDDRLEEVRRTSFPNVQTAGRFDPSTAQTTTGLPNDFLLGAGPEVNQTRILQLRTSDAPSIEFAPRAPYLRSTALNNFIGKGWQAPVVAERVQLPANQRRTDANLTGRRPLAQNVQIYDPPGVALVAADPLEASASLWFDYDAQGQLISTDIVARNYTVVAAIPAVSDTALETLPAWDAATNPLPAGFEAYLQLPPSTTERTRELALQITTDVTEPFAQARAIEEYLRAFPYDLNVEAPPESVSNVADYFLFDLQRGYCDYFATSFVVLARAIGLPTRFVIGYAPGAWQEDERAWIVTAAQAHAWPEVYFPQVGWIPFEPTSGIAALHRVGVDSLDGSQPVPEPPQQSQDDFVESFNWNWQMLVWLLPIGAVVWGAWVLVVRIHRNRQDPWLALLAWGNRHGRPHATGETPVEYAHAIAALAITLNRRSPEASRTVARESVALAEAVAATQYAIPANRANARAEALSRWQRIRDLLPLLRR